MDKHGRWKNAVKEKGLRVNVNKTKGMQLIFGKKSSVLKVDPCDICGEQIGFHRRCSDLPRQVNLLSCWDVFVCRT